MEPHCPSSQLCDECVDHCARLMKGVAQRRGEQWAREVSKDFDRGSMVWPTESAKVRDIARRRVQDLTRDPRLLERLAAEAIVGAARWWAEGDKPVPAPMPANAAG